MGWFLIPATEPVDAVVQAECAYCQNWHPCSQRMGGLWKKQALFYFQLWKQPPGVVLSRKISDIVVVAEVVQGVWEKNNFTTQMLIAKFVTCLSFFLENEVNLPLCSMKLPYKERVSYYTEQIPYKYESWIYPCNIWWQLVVSPQLKSTMQAWIRHHLILVPYIIPGFLSFPRIVVLPSFEGYSKTSTHSTHQTEVHIELWLSQYR